MKTQLSNFLHKALLGDLLADASIERSGKNCRVTYSFGSGFLAYANWTYQLLSAYCSSSVYQAKSRATAGGKEHTNYRLKTRTMPVFNQYRELFYKEGPDGKFTKVVPACIKEEMDPVVLAHMIMGDGSHSPTEGRTRIYTNSFTRDECQLLADAITVNLGIKCSVTLDRVSKKGVSQYILSIPKSQLSQLQQVVGPHMCSSMLYRVGLLAVFPLCLFSYSVVAGGVSPFYGLIPL